MEIFGFEIKKRVAANSQEPEKEKNIKSFVPPFDDEGISTIAAGGYYGQYYDIDGTNTGSDKELILKNRTAAEQPECDTAIDDIVDESIAAGLTGASVDLNLDDLNYEDDFIKSTHNPEDMGFTIIEKKKTYNYIGDIDNWDSIFEDRNFLINYFNGRRFMNGDFELNMKGVN